MKFCINFNWILLPRPNHTPNVSDGDEFIHSRRGARQPTLIADQTSAEREQKAAFNVQKKSVRALMRVVQTAARLIMRFIT